MNSGKDLEVANLFVSDFVNEISQVHPKEIEYILLTGSASRGDFVLGESDLDIVIGIKKDEKASRVKETAHDIFWKLDKKYDTGFLEAEKKAKNSRFSSIFAKNEPFEPVDIEALEMKAASIFQKIFRIFDPFIGYTASRMRHCRISGKMLYGRDIKPLLEKKESELHPFQKLFTYEFFISTLSSFLVFILPDKALKRAFRCVILTFEDKIIRKQDCPFAMKAFRSRMEFGKVKKEWSYLDKISFCLLTPFQIFFYNYKNAFSR